jgi:predicted MFS family arabinose efflux permease
VVGARATISEADERDVVDTKVLRTILRLPRYNPRMSDESSLAQRRWLILASSVVSFFAVGVTFFAVPPLVPQLTETFGLTHLQIGVLMGAIAIPAVFISISLGSAVDRWPARATGTVGLSVMAVGATAFALAPSYTALLTGRLVFGVGGLIVNLLMARLVTEAFRRHELSLAMGIFNSVYPTSMIVMFTVHPRLIDLIGWRGELLVLAGLALLAVPLHVCAVPAVFRGNDHETDLAKNRGRVTPALARLAVAWALFFGVYAAVFTFAPDWAGGGPDALLTVSLVAWTALIFAPIVGVAIDRVGHPSRWLSLSLALLGITLFGMSLGSIPAAPAMVLVGLSAGSALTSTSSLPGRLVPAANFGFAFGFITAFSNLATLIGPATTGAIKDNVAGWATPWAVLASTAVAGALFAASIRPRAPTD